MADKLSPAQRSVNMAKIRSRDTGPEIVVRKLLHANGYRYRLHVRKMPGKPDIVFAARRKVIFVHGCFWHQHAAEACLDGRKPRSNTGYWHAKLARNVERDVDAVRRLERDGWQVMILWECEIERSRDLTKRLTEFLGPPRESSA
jgi:DNA mismatch endonuclease (patch repair protein)